VIVGSSIVDRNAYLFDGKKANILKFKTEDAIKCVSFNERGDIVIVGSMDGKAYFLSAKTFKKMGQFEAEGSINCISYYSPVNKPLYFL